MIHAPEWAAGFQRKAKVPALLNHSNMDKDMIADVPREVFERMVTMAATRDPKP